MVVSVHDLASSTILNFADANIGWGPTLRATNQKGFGFVQGKHEEASEMLGGARGKTRKVSDVHRHVIDMGCWIL